jgi:hypothetical protein
MQVLVSDFSGGTDEFTNSSLIGASDYLYALCGKYGIAAQSIVTSPGYVSPINPPLQTGLISPMKITSFNFANATEWNGNNSYGQEVLPNTQLEVYWNDLGRFLTEGTEWARTSQGFQIINNGTTISGFDAVLNSYVFYIYIS